MHMQKKNEWSNMRVNYTRRNKLQSKANTVASLTNKQVLWTNVVNHLIDNYLDIATQSFMEQHRTKTHNGALAYIGE